MSEQETKELKEKELEEIAGGIASRSPNITYIHKNCGGVLLNVGNPFASVECSSCHEKHYFTSDFSYEKKYN